MLATSKQITEWLPVAALTRHWWVVCCRLQWVRSHLGQNTAYEAVNYCHDRTSLMCRCMGPIHTRSIAEQTSHMSTMPVTHSITYSRYTVNRQTERSHVGQLCYSVKSDKPFLWRTVTNWSCWRSSYWIMLTSDDCPYQMSWNDIILPTPSTESFVSVSDEDKRNSRNRLRQWKAKMYCSTSSDSDEQGEC